MKPPLSRRDVTAPATRLNESQARAIRIIRHDQPLSRASGGDTFKIPGMFADEELAARVATLEAIHAQELAAFRWRMVRSNTPEKTMESIAEAVAKACGVNLRDARQMGRKRLHCLPRMIAMHIQRKHTSTPTEAIAHWWGKKDHGTVLHACKVIENRMETEPKFKEHVEGVKL